VPNPSPQLTTRLNDLNATLFEHYRSRGRTLPEQVFPYQALTRAQQTRYRLLSLPSSKSDGLYLFATLIRQVQDQIPDLIAALVVVVDTLGPQRVAFTFLEGPSDDLTPSVFNSILQPLLLSLGVPSRRIRIITDSPSVDFNNGNRIELLANLRNDALQPLWQNSAFGTNVKSVVFFNDVYLKAEHILELLYVHQINGAGMTAAWDWYKREPAYFYDVWVGRTVSPSILYTLLSLISTRSIDRHRRPILPDPQHLVVPLRRPVPRLSRIPHGIQKPRTISGVLRLERDGHYGSEAVLAAA
jgi:alpha-1,3-mannosyltransferase